MLIIWKVWYILFDLLIWIILFDLLIWIIWFQTLQTLPDGFRHFREFVKLLMQSQTLWLHPKSTHILAMHSWTLRLPCVLLTHSQPDAPLTFPLLRVKSIPNTHAHSQPNAIWPSLFLASSPFLTFSSVSQLQSGEAQSRTSLARCILVYLSSPSIYLFPSHLLYVSSVSSFATLRLFLCLILSSPSPSTLVSSIFIPYLRWPYFTYSILSLRPIPNRSDHPNPYHTLTCINTLVTSCCSSVW